MDVSSDFASLALAPPLLRAVAEAGYTEPTPIQRRAIPEVLQGRDLLAAAQTGTGKTAGFTLPILHMLAGRGKATRPGRPRCLILVPTRELAAQVEESVRTYGRYLPLTSMVMFGGVNINPQLAALRRTVDVLVATPGRLLDHVGQRSVDLSAVEILVLDEADRMLDMGFIRDIRKVLALLPGRRQNLLFSATFSDEIRRLATDLLHDPASIEVARRNAPAEMVEQTVHQVDRSKKRALLAHLISSGRWSQVLVFTRTKHGANRLVEQLGRDGIEAMAIHGNKSQGARTRALGAFREGRLPVLVATDIAARGLDIDQLPHVVNYELPTVAEDYVHRIGRTGRAGSPGAAVSLIEPQERPLLAAVERLLGRNLPVVEVAGLTGWTGQPESEPEHPAEVRARTGRRPARGGGGSAQRGAPGTRGASSGRRPAAAGAPPSAAPRGGSGSRRRGDSRRDQGTRG